MALLQAREHVEAAAAAGAPHRVLGVGEAVQLGQHEAGHDQAAGQEVGLDDLGDAAVDDRVAVEDLEVGAALLAHLEQVLVEVVELGRLAQRDDEAEHAEREEAQQRVLVPDLVDLLVAHLEHGVVDQARDDDADRHAEHAGDQGQEVELRDHVLDADDEQADAEADGEAGGGRRDLSEVDDGGTDEDDGETEYHGVHGMPPTEDMTE